MTPRLLCLLALAASAAAQPAPPAAPPASAPPASAPPAGGASERGVEVRVTGGLASLSLGDAAAFHQSAVRAYVDAGVPVPTQRSFPAGLSGGVDVLWPRSAFGGGQSRFGVGARFAGAEAQSLYGDYAGTLDLVSTVSALFVESVSVVELGGGRVRPFLGSRGGTVLASSATEESLDLGELGASRSRVGGRGVGYSLEGFGGLAAGAGRVGVFVQGGYRYARVPRLDGEVRVDGAAVGEGRLPYGLGLSGWSGAIGLTVRP